MCLFAASFLVAPLASANPPVNNPHGPVAIVSHVDGGNKVTSHVQGHPQVQAHVTEGTVDHMQAEAHRVGGALRAAERLSSVVSASGSSGTYLASVRISALRGALAVAEARKTQFRPEPVFQATNEVDTIASQIAAEHTGDPKAAQADVTHVLEVAAGYYKAATAKLVQAETTAKAFGNTEAHQQAIVQAKHEVEATGVNLKTAFQLRNALFVNHFKGEPIREFDGITIETVAEQRPVE
jgi:hypothetical protein